MSAEPNKLVVLSSLRAKLAESQDGVLEALAAENGVTTRDVVDCLPESCRKGVDGALFEEVMADLTTWGDVTFLVHTKDVILECKAAVPAGKPGHGYFNFDGHGPLGGHLRYGNCAAIHFVRRTFMKRDSCAILFFNGEGEAMFKVYVGRDETRALRADQVARFEALRDRLAGAEAPLWQGRAANLL